MTYAQDGVRAITVLTEQRKQQELIATRADSDITVFQGLLKEAQLKEASSRALIAAIDKALDALHDQLPDPVDDITDEEDFGDEDPYEAAFETTAEPEPAKDQTFDHRAPMFVNTAPDRGEPVGWDNPL
jgi:hypothetical protein